MARFNEILVGNYNRFLQKHLGMKGPPVAPQLAAELQPTINFPWGNENAWLFGWNQFSFFNLLGAQGAHRGVFRLRNPAGSGVVALVTRVLFYDITNLAVEQFRISYAHVDGAADNVDLTVYAGAANWDTRGQARSSASIVSTGFSDTVGVAPVVSVWLGGGGAAGTGPAVEALRPHEADFLPLPPGDALSFFNQTANNNFSCCFFWKERLLEESERS